VTQTFTLAMDASVIASTVAVFVASASGTVPSFVVVCTFKELVGAICRISTYEMITGMGTWFSTATSGTE
jgi:hypothetical protein